MENYSIYNSKLSFKIRQQAEQLQELENYNNLCEQTLADLQNKQPLSISKPPTKRVVPTTTPLKRTLTNLPRRPTPLKSGTTSGFKTPTSRSVSTSRFSENSKDNRDSNLFKLQDENNKQKQLIGIMESQVAEYRSAFEKAQVRENNITASIDAIRTAQNEIYKIEEEKSVLIEHIDTLQANEKVLRRQVSEQENLQEQIGGLKGQVDLLTHSNEQLSYDLGKHQGKKRAYKAKLRSLEEQVSQESSKQTQSFEDMTNDLKKRCNDQENKIIALQSEKKEMEKLYNTLAESNSAQTAKINSLQTKVATQQAQIQDTSVMLEQSTEIENLKSEVEKYREKSSSLEQSISVQSSQQLSEMTSTSKQLKKYKEQNFTLENNLVKAKKEITKKRDKIRTMKQDFERENQSLLRENSRYQTDKENLIREKQNLTHKLEDLTMTTEKLEDLSIQIESNQTDVAVVENKLKSVEILVFNCIDLVNLASANAIASYPQILSEELKSTMQKMISSTEQDAVENLIMLENWIKVSISSMGDLAIELEESRTEKNNLGEELSFARDKIEALLTSDNQAKELHTTTSSRQEPQSYEFLENKISLLVKEKKDLELINRKLQSVLPSSDLQRAFQQIIRIRNDIEIEEREKFRLQSLLRKWNQQLETRKEGSQNDMILHEMNKIKESITSCEHKIAKFRENLSDLDVELGRITDESKNYGFSFTVGSDENSFFPPALKIGVTTPSEIGPLKESPINASLFSDNLLSDF